MTMMHPGLASWAFYAVVFAMVVLSIGFLLRTPVRAQSTPGQQLSGWILGTFMRNPVVLFMLKLVFAAIFILIIIAGLFGTPIPERNMATVLTWNLWWAGLIFSVFFLGSAWCAVCPWDALAQWMVRRRLWRRGTMTNSLDLAVPRWLRSVWPALFMFVALTWLELGLGITLDPYATAMVSLLMVLLATVSLSVFKRKAFCRYFCPVGRTVGFYAQLSVVALRPIDAQRCAECTTLECYHGSDSVEPCPTGLVMGTLTQNTYCTSCGNCVRSCPESNVAWSLRSPSIEAISDARPHWDEGWFMVTLLALTAFHGLSMMPFWENWINLLAGTIGDSGRLLMSFSIALSAVILLLAMFYSAFVLLLQKIFRRPFRELFVIFAFINLPFAFSYHMAHNLNHLIREGAGLGNIFVNPLGVGTLPLSVAEKHERMTMWFSQDMLGAIQAVLMIFGFWIALQVIHHRSAKLQPASNLQLLPMLFYALGVTGFHLWMLAQPMIMRM